MDFNKIEYFLVLAKNLNYAEAAKELYISPQALSKQIILLENEIGEKLFERTTRSVKLTDIGQLCYEQFSSVKAQYDSTVKTIVELVKSKQETIRIGFLSALPKNEVITPILQIISESCPKLNIEIVADGLDEVRDLLEEEKIDLCITNIHEYENWPNCNVVKLASMPAKIVISLYHPWVMKEYITEEDIQKATILLYKKKRPFDSESFYKKVICKNKQFSNNFDSMLATLEIGKDFAVFPKIFDYMYKAKFKYFDLPEKWKFQYFMAAIYKKDNYNPNLKNILDNLQEDLKLNLN